MTYSEVRDVEVFGGQVRTQVLIGGDGPPLLYLASVLGLAWDPFLDSLAQHHTVYAPFLPGTAPGDPDAHKAIVDLWDLVLCYDEICDGLALDSPAVVGHSFGGMLAAELAATFPARVSKLVLITPVGLWTEGRIFNNPYVVGLENIAPYIFADPTGPVAAAAMAMPTDPEELGEAMISVHWAMGVAGKFWWPIPDRGLDRRIHRITADTLIIWGASDRLIDPAYAADFARLIPSARAEVLDGAAHMPQFERPDVVVPLVADFLS